MIVPIILGILALAFFLDGIVTVFSSRYFEHRQKFFRMVTKAPPNINANKYFLINRIIAGLSTIAGGCVLSYWILQYIGTL